MVRRTVESRVAGNAADLLGRCQRALMASGAGVTSRNDVAGKLIASKGVSWRSWGELLVVEVSPIGASECVVRASSQSRVAITPVDWGRNSDHLNRFLEALNAQVGADRPASK